MPRGLLHSLLAAALGLAVLVGIAPTTPADGELWSARLLDLSASYGSEAWKYDPAYEGQATPNVVAAHLENQTTSYYGALGLRLTLRIELFKVDDANAQPTSSHNVSAFITTTRGPLAALVKREGTSGTFNLDFDLDGATNAAPDGQTPPPADAGPKTVQLNVFRRVTDNPRPEPAGEAQFQFSYEIPFATARSDALDGLLHQQPVPDNIFRLFTDVGWDRSVQYFYRPLDPAQSLDVSYEFSPSAAGQTVELYGFVAERGVAEAAPGGPAPAPLPTPPFVPGVSDNQTFQSLLENADRLVVVTKQLLATGRVEANGTVRFTVQGSDLLGIRPVATNAALVAVAPMLLDNFDPAACPGDCRGGAEFRVGATELVVPVTSNRVVVDGYQLADPAVSGGQAPEGVRDVAIAANALRVRVRDLEGFAASDSRVGDVYAIVPEGRSTTPLGGARLSRGIPQDPQQEETLLTGDLSVRSIQAQHVSHYRVLALLYGTNDAFVGATFADRGYVVQLNAPVVPPGTGGVWVNITSRTTNYDALADDPLFDIKVYYDLAVPDLNVNESGEQTLREGATSSMFYTLTSSQEGSFPVSIESTSGDVLPRANTVNAEFREPEPKRSFVDRLPGPDAALVAFALLGGLMLLRRRR